MTKNHDQLMKELIASFPDQFLRLAAPEVAEQVATEALAFEPEEHYFDSPTGRARRADLVAVAACRPALASGEADEVLIHVEIELENRARVELKLLRYHRGLSLKYGLPVHTIVLYLRGGPAGSRERVFEERSLGRMVGAFGYHSLGLSQAPAAVYLARPEPLAWGLAALARPARGQRRSKLGLSCMTRITADPGLTRGKRRLLLACVFTYADFDDDDAQEFDRITAELDDEEVLGMRMSMTERWRREGLEKGLEQGLEQGLERGLEKGLERGIQKGRAEGVRDLVIQLLRQRFGDLSSEVERRVAAIASTEELGSLAARVYQVESLEELGLA